MATEGVRRVFGVVCGSGVYGLSSGGVPIVQVLFADLEDRVPHDPRLRTLLVRAPPVKDRELLDGLSRTYLSAITAVDSERTKIIDRRCRALANTLLSRSGPLSALRRHFAPIRVTLDRDETEILYAEEVPDVGECLHPLEGHDVARLSVVGSYSSEDSESGPSLPSPRVAVKQTASPSNVVRSSRIRPGTSSSRDSGASSEGDQACVIFHENRTHASRKLRRGYAVREVTFSITSCGRKYIFEPDRVSQWPIDRVFSTRDVTFAGLKLRLVTPVGFLAIVACEDRCLLLLRAALRAMHGVLYAGFSGEKPMFDYLGPDMWSQGGPRSVFFPSFPFMSVYLVSSARAMGSETAGDAIQEIKSSCGLPDIVGEVGKLDFCLPCPTPAKISDEDLFVFNDPLKPFRMNGAFFREQTVQTGERHERVHVHVGGGRVFRLAIPTLREALLRRCLKQEYYPGASWKRGRRSQWEVCTRFLDRLRHRSRALHDYIRGLEGFISHHITSACTAAGFRWLVVRHDAEFFVGVPKGVNDSAEVCVSTVFGCYWRRLFGDFDPEPECSLIGSGPAVFVMASDCLLGAFGAVNEDGTSPENWLAVAGRAASDVFTATLDPDWWCTANLRELLLKTLFTLISYRHRAPFWMQKMKPCEYVVEHHTGVMDCAPFNGVYLGGERVAIQPADSALHDRVDYLFYLRRVIAYATIGVEATVESLCDCDRERLAQVKRTVAEVQRDLENDYSQLFHIN